MQLQVERWTHPLRAAVRFQGALRNNRNTHRRATRLTVPGTTTQPRSLCHGGTPPSTTVAHSVARWATRASGYRRALSLPPSGASHSLAIADAPRSTRALAVQPPDGVVRRRVVPCYLPGSDARLRALRPRHQAAAARGHNEAYTLLVGRPQAATPTARPLRHRRRRPRIALRSPSWTWTS